MSHSEIRSKCAAAGLGPEVAAAFIEAEVPAARVARVVDHSPARDAFNLVLQARTYGKAWDAVLARLAPSARRNAEPGESSQGALEVDRPGGEVSRNQEARRPNPRAAIDATWGEVVAAQNQSLGLGASLPPTAAPSSQTASEIWDEIVARQNMAHGLKTPIRQLFNEEKPECL